MGLLDFLKRKAKPIDNKYVFDKAKFHDKSVEQMGLDEEQSYVHTGLFFAWLVNNGLMSDFFILEAGDEIEQLNSRKISPSTIYINWDGVLIGEMLNHKGFNFAMSYFDFDKGNYVNDYKKVFSVTDENFFIIKDTWDNYERLRSTIDTAYKNWNK